MESITYTLIISLVAFAVYFSALISYHVILSDTFESRQKFWIVVIAWFVPIIGPSFIITILAEDKTRKRKQFIPILDFIFMASFVAQLGNQMGSSDFTADDNHSSYEDSSDD